MPDFFLDDFDSYAEKKSNLNKPRFVDGKDTQKSSAAAPAPGSSGSSGKSVQAVFDRMDKLMSEELVQKTKAVYQFNVKG